MIYVDNAATSWPKPKTVVEEIENCLVNYCANPGRSGHNMSIASEQTVYGCREKLSKMFGVEDPSAIIFTNNATSALNTVIKGLIKPQNHVILSSMEHNSVLRPVAACGAEYDVVNADRFGYVEPGDFEKLIKNNTALIICTLSSNVCGSVQPFEKIAEISHKYGIPFLLDASQGAGTINIDMKKMKIDYLACPGHKGLLGPTGTGVLCINSSLHPNTLCEGGTGSYSKLLKQPDFLPDKYESGTLNVVGIAGLTKGLEFIENIGMDKILQSELELTDYFASELCKIPGVKLIGYNNKRQRTGVLSFVIENMDSLVAASKLNYDYNIALRAGYHCAYNAHCSLGTEKTGTLRVSFGPFNTLDEADIILKAVKNISLQI